MISMKYYYDRDTKPDAHLNHTFIFYCIKKTEIIETESV